MTRKLRDGRAILVHTGTESSQQAGKQLAQPAGDHLD